VVLNRGESWLINGGIKKGGRVVASKPVQADLLVGRVGATYASDWFTLYPVEAWDNSYYTPVGTSASGNPAFVYLFNPNTNAINIEYNTRVSSGSFAVPASNGVYQFQMPVKSGASFSCSGERNFFAICTVAANPASDTAYNWGFTLVPKGALTTEATVGWGPGSADGTVNGSPVWVTTLANTRVYADYKGDRSGPLTDPNGNRYDVHFDLLTLQSQTIYDPSKDQTGMRVYTVDGTLLTAAWGEDPDVAAPGNPYIDAGTTVLPFPVPLLRKSAIIHTDLGTPGLSLNDILEYTVEVDNKGLAPLGNVVVIDAPSANLSYVADSTTLDGNPIPDSPSGTLFPLDAPGYTIPVILRGGSTTFKYRCSVQSGGVISNSVNIGGTAIMTMLNLVPPPVSGPFCSLNFSDSSGVPVSVYAVGADVFVTMTNAVGNTSSNTIQVISVPVQNVTRGDAETILLSETGTNSGVFRNLSGLPTSSSSGLGQQDGAMHVLPGDLLSVAYTDPTFGNSASNTAMIQIPSRAKQLYLSVNGSTNGTQALNRIDPVANGLGPARTSVDIGTATSSSIGLDRVSVGSNTTATVTISHATASGPNRLMLVGVSLNRATGTTYEQVTNVTYSGIRLTRIGARTNTATGEALVYIWGLTNPPAGTANVVVSLNTNAADGFVAGVATFTNVDQSTPYGPFFSTIGTSTAVSNVVASAAGELVFDTVMLRSTDFGATGSPGAGQTQLWKRYYNNRVGAGSSTKPGALSVTNTWTAAASADWTIGGVSIKPAASPGGPGTNVTVFTQTPAFSSSFTMPSNNVITITNYITITNGSLSASPAVTATLRYGGTTFLTLTNPVFSSANSNLVWSGVLTSNVTIPTGQAISYVISNGVSGVAFHVDYDSTNKPSKITLPTTSVINIAGLGVYDAPCPGGSLVTAPLAGSTLYVRAQVTDPFGSYDITGLGLAITAPDTNANVNVTLNDANVVASDAGSKTYEYVWQTGPVTGGYTVAATALEGTEGVTDTAATSLSLIFLDLGTPSSTAFTSGINGPATNGFGPDATLFLRVSDLNRNTNSTAADTLTVTVTSSSGDSEVVTLTETGADTGIFAGSLPAGTTAGVGANNGTLHAPVGSILTANYTDPADPADTTTATATVLPPPGVPGVAINTTLVSPSGSQVSLGQPATFNLQVVNTGSTTLTNLTVTDDFPTGLLGYQSASLTPNVVASGTLTWTNLGPLTPGQSLTIMVTFNTLATGMATNASSVNGSSASGSSSAAVLITHAEVTVAIALLSPTNSPVAVGSNIVFRVTIENIGNTVIPFLPLENGFSGAHYEFVSASPAPDGTGSGTLLWTNLTSPIPLATNATLTLDVTMKVVGAGDPANIRAEVQFASDIYGNPVPAASATLAITTAASLITGHVYDDKDQTGSLTAGDLPLSGITLRLFTDPNDDGDPADGSLVQATTTDANGCYELLNLNLGKYVVVETDLPGYASIAPANNRIAVDVSTLCTNANVDFFDYQPSPTLYSTVSGTVWSDANQNGTNDVGEVGIPNVTIRLVQDVNTNAVVDAGEPVVASVTTDADGGFSFAGITPGSYVILETPLYGYYSTGTNQIGIAVTGGNPSTNHSFFDHLNQPPVANGVTASTPENTSVLIAALLNDSDPDGNPLTLVGIAATNGVAAILDGTNVVFTPDTNFVGSASVGYTVSDGYGGTAVGLITITVTLVNDPPTLNPISNMVIDEGAGLQTVNLGGISVGATNESGQTITVTASSDNPSVVPDPIVNYTSPDATGTLTFTPLTNTFGTATITVVVQDDGGTANGGVDAITNTFTVTVNAITNVWLPDGSLSVDVNDATGLPGTGYTQTNYVGVLDLQATASNPFTIHLVSFDGASPGLAANFDYHVTNTWTIATTTRGVTGFDPAKFVVNDSQFSNDLAGGTFTVELSGDGLSVNVVFLPNHAPVAAVANYGRAWGTSLRIPITHLLTNHTSDADGDGRGLAVLGVSTNGAWISTNTAYIYFSPTNNLSESFQYVIRDLRSYRLGDTVQMATNLVTVSVTNAVGQARSISASGPNIRIQFAGVPGFAYDVERTTNIASGVWIVLQTTNAPAHGVWEFLDANPPMPAAFYRIKQH
jgi:uncharacterized repeat protein (TIGR01451 family)